MVTINRVRVTATGFPGGPGVQTFYSSATGAPNLAALRNAYAASVTLQPAGMTYQIENVGDTIDADTGKITGTWNSTAQAPVAMTGAGSFASPVGGYITWLTDTITAPSQPGRAGRHLKGRTFFVPLMTGNYSTTGTLLAGSVTLLQNFATAFLATGGASQWCVWSRPLVSEGTEGAPPAIQRPGNAGVITSSRVTTKTAVLRSHRD